MTQAQALTQRLSQLNELRNMLEDRHLDRDQLIEKIEDMQRRMRMEINKLTRQDEAKSQPAHATP